jgi:cytochrome oxidase assembly protein ShyY1
VKLPLVPTIVVAAAVATMIALGIWQLSRAGEKEELIASYRAASGLAPVAWPAMPGDREALLYRRATGFCTEITGWRAVAGRNRQGQPGWGHIAACRTGGLEGPGMQVDMGWSREHGDPQGWRGGAVAGTIAPDRDHGIRLVSDAPAPGLQPTAAPNPEDLPNNHMMYAWQWFFFALTAAIIYVLALRRREPATAPEATPDPVNVADGPPKP